MDTTASFDDELTDRIRRAMPFVGVVGIEILEIHADQVRARLGWSPELCTAGGVMHGGALMALADVVGATLAYLNLPEQASGTTTVNSNTSFFRGLREGYAFATARLLHRGRSTIVTETDLTDGDDRRLARVTQTQAVLKPR